MADLGRNNSFPKNVMDEDAVFLYKSFVSG